MAAGTAAAVAGGVNAVAPAADDPAVPVKAGWIDAHSHIWTPDLDRFPLEAGQTRADLKPLSFSDDELMAIAGPLGVRRVVLIQHSVYHGFDNRLLIDAYHRHPDRFRVVGMVDSRLPGAGGKMRELRAHGVTGFRITPFKVGPDWLQTDGMAEMWKTAVETRQAMCCLLNAADLPGVDRMCERFPDTPVVIDHFARIGVDGEIREADVAALCRLARHRHTAVKVSAFYALGRKQPPHDELLPMTRRLLEAFGQQRLMWASDSPYQLENGNSYASSLRLITERASFLSEADRQWLLRGTAERVFAFV